MDPQANGIHLVDDPVHVEVETVEFRDLVLLHRLAQTRITFADPSVELGNSHRQTVFCLFVSLFFRFLLLFLVGRNRQIRRCVHACLRLFHKYADVDMQNESTEGRGERKGGKVLKVPFEQYKT